MRNQAYRKSEFSIRERHNERKNVSYGNGDIVAERSKLNVHFKSCSETYEQQFSRLVDEGVVSLRGLKSDAKVFDELVFDVNSAYFETHDSYEYASKFFAEAYKLAVKEAGGEKYVLSAVLHADERNKALSEKYGKDVFHYHLHVVYIPVVDKEVYYKKNNPNPELAGKLKEVLKQVSHSKKWPRNKDDEGHWVNSYSLLQDRFFNHMQDAGFVDFERGERGSTSKHLSVLEYKTQQEAKRVDAQTKRLDVLKHKTAIAKGEAITFSELEQADRKTLSNLAKEGVKARGRIADLKEKLSQQYQSNLDLRQRLQSLEGSGFSETIEYYQAKARAPKRLSEIVADILEQPPEPQTQVKARQKVLETTR